MAWKKRFNSKISKTRDCWGPPKNSFCTMHRSTAQIAKFNLHHTFPPHLTDLQKRKIFRHRKRNEQPLIYPLIYPSNLQFLETILVMDSSRFYLFHSSRKPVPNPSFKLEFTVQLVEFSTTEFDCVWSASWSWVSEGPPGSIPQA